MTSETETEETQDDLDTFFEDQEEETKAEETQTEEETKDKGETEPEKEKVKTEEPAPPADKEEKLVPKAALHDERRRRQQAEEELKDLRKLIPATDEEPDAYEDQDAWKEWYKNKMQGEQKAAQEKLTKDRLDKSRSKMLEAESDYEAMERLFGVMLADDPSLRDKMLASGDEGKFVYDTAKKYREEQLNPTKKPKPEPETPEIDGANLATATAQDTNTPKVEKEESLEEMFDDQKY